MASTAHIGESRALVFPVMCNGYLQLDYSDHNTADYKHNFWNHKDEPFTLEAIITPFDVNGIGHRSSGQGRLDSIKTPPSPNSSLTQSDYQSVDYFGSGRNTHKMMLFHNPYFQFYLQNTTSSNFNQPAEYKLVVKVAHGVSGGTVDTVETEKVFVASNRLKGYYDENGLYQQKGIVTDKTKLSSSTTAAFDQASLQVTGNLTNFTNTEATLDQSSIQVTGDLTSFTNTAAGSATLGTGTITVTNQPTSSHLDVAASSGTKATGAIVFSTGWTGSTITTSSSASSNNAVILRNRQTGSGGSSNKTYRFFMCSQAIGNGWPSEMTGTGARSFTFTEIENDQVTGGASLAEDLSTLGYGASDTQIDVFVPEFGNAGGSNTSGANWRWMLGAAINQLNGSGSNPSSGLDITATDLTSTSGIAGTINLQQDAVGAAGNHSTTPNTGPVIGSNIADSGKLTATVFGGTGMTVGTDATSASNVDYYITVTMRNASGGSPVTKYFKFFSGSFTAGALDTNSTTSVSPVHKVMIGGNTTATASHLANAINNAFTGTGFSGNEASNNSSNIVTITSPNTGTQSGQTLSRVSGYSGIISIGSNPFSNYVAGSSAVTPTAFITLTDSGGNTIRYKPSKGDNSETTGSTGTENSGVTYFLVNASDNAATAANLRSAILNSSSGHAQFNPALSTSISTNTITITATSTGGSHNLSSTGISSGLSLTNFTGGVAASTPTAFITLTDSAGNTIRYKPSKGDNSETTGSTGTENGGVTYFLVDASNNNTTAANLRSAILNNSSGHAQFSPALSASIVSNTITLTATAASGSHSLTSTGISSGLSLTNFSGGTANSFTVGSGEADGIGAGNLIYDNTGTLIGTVSSVNGNNVTLTASPATTITSTTYISQKKEALYLEKTSKVSCTFDRGTVSIYLDNNLLIRKRIYAIDFEFDDVDCYIGQDGSNTNTQFMGELYEIAMHKGLEPCRTISTLTPNYGDTMFYYSFGD